MAAENDESCKFEDDPGYPYLEVSREEKSVNAAKPFDSKKNCWIPDSEDGKLNLKKYLPSTRRKELRKN